MKVWPIVAYRLTQRLQLGLCSPYLLMATFVMLVWRQEETEAKQYLCILYNVLTLHYNAARQHEQF